MVLPLHRRLAFRLFLIVGAAAVLPLILVVTTVMVQSYQLTRAKTSASLQQLGRLYAAEAGAWLGRKLDLAEDLVLLSDQYEPGDVIPLLRRSPDVADLTLTAPGPREVTELKVSGGLATLSHSAKGAGTASVTFRLDGLRSLVLGLRPLDAGYAFVTSHAGVRLIHPRSDLEGMVVANDLPPAEAQSVRGKLSANGEFSLEKVSLVTKEWSWQYYAPIPVKGLAEPWYLVTVAPADLASRELDQLFLLLSLGALATVMITAVAVWWATQLALRPLAQVVAGAEAVSAGHLGTRVPVRARDEVGLLAGAFNSMTQRLQVTMEEQEQLVDERTASLAQSLADLERAQLRIVKSEKLAALGQLAAGVAHEVNTPLAAIQSSAGFLQAEGRRELTLFVRSADEETFAWYQELVEGPSPPQERGTAQRRRQKALVDALRSAEIEDPEGTAEDIALLVAPEAYEATVSRLRTGGREAVRRAARTVTARRATAIIAEAAARAAGVVAALEGYSRTALPRVVAVDPAHELDSLLALYYGLTQQGVDVVRDYDTGVTVPGDREQLNQVWVNLINNALQAMDYHGRLVLRVKRCEAGVEVAVANNGPPVPEGLEERIFEPFFSTKRPEEGAGLGLGLCRTIVDAHKGTLRLSREGELTVFSVSLPGASP